MEYSRKSRSMQLLLMPLRRQDINGDYINYIKWGRSGDPWE